MATGVSDEFFETQDKVIGDLVRKFHKKLDDFEIDVKSTMRSVQQGSSMQCFNIAFMFLTQVFPNLSGVVTASGQSRSEVAELWERLRKVEESQTEHNQKQKHLERSQNDIKKTQSQYKKSQTQLEQKQTQYEKNQIQLEQKQTQFEKTQKQHKKTQTQLEQKQTLFEKTQTQHEKTQTQLEQKQTQLEKTQTQHEITQTQLEQKQKQLEKTQKKHKRQNKNSQQKQCKDIQGLGIKVNAINKDIKELTKATNQIWGLRKLQKLLISKTQSPQAAAATTSSAAAASTTASASPCGPIRSLSQRTSFTARTDKDTYTPGIRDVKLLPGGLTVFADVANNCVKLFTIAGQHLHSVRTGGSPARLAIVDVTATHSWQVAATLPLSNEIAMLEVTQHGVTVKRIIPISRQYEAIAAVDSNTFAVGHWLYKGIDLIDHTGNVIRRISSDLCLCYMVWSPDQTLVMTGSGLIAKVNIKDGSAVYKHRVEQVQTLGGITCHQDGSCIVTDRVTRTLHLVTSDGVWVRQLWAHPAGADGYDVLSSVCSFQNMCLCCTKSGSVCVLDIL